MLNWLGIGRSRSQAELPAEIYIPLVDSLYSEKRTLFLGSLAVSLAVLLTAWKDSSGWLYVCWLLLVAIAVARAADMSSYARRRPELHTATAAREWEYRYVAGAAG